MTTRHTITVADETYIGNVAYQPYMGLDGGRRGLLSSHMFVQRYGTIAATASEAIVGIAATTTTGTSITLTGTLVANGIATFDVPRTVRVTATANTATTTFTISGKDLYGIAMTEAIVGPNNTTAFGVKAFLTVSSVAISSAVANATAVNIGTASTIGLPIRVAQKSDVFINADGFTASVTPSITVGLTATISTSTTADVRGTFVMGPAASTVTSWAAWMTVPDHSTATAVFGTTQA